MINKEELHKQGELVYDNSHSQESVAFEVIIDFGQLSSWDDPYKLFINGELKASYKTFSGVEKRARSLISLHDLRKVSDEGI